MLFSSIISLLTFSTAYAAYSKDGKNNAVYWGQGDNQEPLASYCQRGDIDIAMISFLKNWDSSSASANFGNSCDGKTCDQLAKDIKTCQDLGVKVLLSLGGDTSTATYGLKEDSQGSSAAQVIYDMFHPNGKGSVRPFAVNSVELDGFDFDIENENQTGLANLVASLRKLWTTKDLIISAAPQCPYPDKNVYKMLQSSDAKVDIAWVQFYNNPACSFNNDAGFKSSWETWYNFVTEQSGNKDMKIYIGVASSTSDDAYFVDAATTAERSQTMLTQSSFGGFCLWDVTSGAAKVSNNVDYVASLKKILEGQTVSKRNEMGTLKQVEVLRP